jgi:hypothetical protein
MHVGFLCLAGDQREHHRPKLVTDIHPTRAKFFGINDNVIGDPKDAFGRVGLRPISVAAGDNLHVHLTFPFGLRTETP